MKARIPFIRPYLSGNELKYIADVVSQAHLSGDGKYTKLCHQWLEKTLGAKKALLTSSCTDALEMTALLLDLGPGDEFIVPSFTFVSTANAFALRGARPVFCDIRPDTLNIDETQIERLITKRTKAIIPVHYAGVSCEMDRILEIGKQYGIAVVEDNAHGLMGGYKGRRLGTMAALATQSFHESKNIMCGEGGALIINDESYIERAEILREKGTDRSKFFRGQVDKYSWVDVGSSFLPSDILAAFLYAQLECFETIQKKRKLLWDTYQTTLPLWALESGVKLPYVPSHCEQTYHLFYILLPSMRERDGLMHYLAKQDIWAVFHYLPLHLSRMGKRYGGKPGDCPVTESVSDRLLRLPLYVDMTDADQMRVVEAVTAYAIDLPKAA